MLIVELFVELLIVVEIVKLYVIRILFIIFNLYFIVEC